MEGKHFLRKSTAKEMRQAYLNNIIDITLSNVQPFRGTYNEPTACYSIVRELMQEPASYFNQVIVGNKRYNFANNHYEYQIRKLDATEVSESFWLNERDINEIEGLHLKVHRYDNMMRVLQIEGQYDHGYSYMPFPNHLIPNEFWKISQADPEAHIETICNILKKQHQGLMSQEEGGIVTHPTNNDNNNSNNNNNIDGNNQQ